MCDGCELLTRTFAAAKLTFTALVKCWHQACISAPGLSQYQWTQAVLLLVPDGLVAPSVAEHRPRYLVSRQNSSAGSCEATCACEMPCHNSFWVI